MVDQLLLRRHTHYRESVVRTTGKNTETAAKALLKRRLGEIEAHTWVGPDEKRVRLSDLRTLLDADYVDKQRRSADRVARAWHHVVDFFPRDPRALTITTKRLHEFVTHRRAEGAAPATIRTELACLLRAFRVAVERQELQASSIPGFPTITVRNARDVFFTTAEVDGVREHLPARLQHLWTGLCVDGVAPE